MLSKTLIGNGLGCWKTIVTRRLSAVGSIAAMSTPSSVIRPLKRRALRQLGQPVQRPQQRRLAAARGSDQREHLALADRQRHGVDGDLRAVGDRHVLDLHPVDRRTRTAATRRGAATKPPERMVAVAVRGRPRRPGLRASARGRLERAAFVAGQAPDGRWLSQLHRNALARRLKTSTPTFSTSTIISSTNAAAYALSRLVAVAGRRVLEDVARQRAAGSAQRAEQRSRAHALEVQRRAEQDDDDRRVADHAADAEHRAGDHRRARCGQQDSAGGRDLRLADRVGGLADVAGNRLQPFADGRRRRAAARPATASRRPRRTIARTRRRRSSG